VTIESKEFVATLVAEMHALFARLGEHQTLESESQGRLEVRILLKLALRSELEASELAGAWLASTPEIDAKMVLARQCGDEMVHYRLILERLAELGEDTDAIQRDPLGDEGYSPLYQYLRGLRGTVERIAGGPFAREAIAEVRNAQFIAFCRMVGDETTAELYERRIDPDEIAHHRLGREFLERHCDTAELQEQAAAAARTTLAIADELRSLTERSTGMHAIPVS
jgi:hypothetical protein